MDIQSFVAGSLGGFAGIIVSHPFDTIKVQIQTQHIHSASPKSAFQILKEAFVSRKPLTLYRGMSSPLVGSMFINSFIFGAESNIRKNLDLEKGTSPLSTYALSGAISGFLSAIILTPIELIKIRMQMANSKYKNSLVCFLQTIKTEGILKFTRGFSITALRETPAVATYFVSFEFLLHYFKSHHDRESKVWELLLAGGTAGCLSWLMTYPVDVVKTRYQSDESHKNIRACYRELLLNEGRRGLWRGLCVTLMRGFPNNAACFATVTLFNRYVVL